MHTHSLDRWRHDHVFAQDRRRPGERRTLFVVTLTAAMMVVEIAAGLTFGSMALLADGLHMASHTAALGIAVIAYVLSRRLAGDRRFAFGTGKLDSLAGFASAVLLLGFAIGMAVESGVRLFNPVVIAYDNALLVAALGLAVNGLSAWLLLETPHVHGEGSHGRQAHQDHNLRAAYLHVLADALTSVLAIVALLAAKYLAIVWLDAVMGLVGAGLVTHWSWTLIRDSGAVLLDGQADPRTLERVRRAIEGDSADRIVDLHVWQIGHGCRAATVTVVSDAPRSPDEYRAMIPAEIGIVHATVEVQRCPEAHS